MLGSVINARDRWLKPGGLILPSSATVSLFKILALNIFAYAIGNASKRLFCLVEA